MAGLLRGKSPDATTPVAFVQFSATDQVWNTTLNTGAGGFEAWTDANVADYGTAATQLGTSGWYKGDEVAGAAYYALCLSPLTLPLVLFWEDVLSVTVDSLTTDGTAAVAAAVLDAQTSAHTAAGSVGAKIGSGGTILVSPIQATTTNPRFSTRDLSPIVQGSEPADGWTITDSQSPPQPVDLSAKVVRFVAYVECQNVLTPAFQYQTGGSGITISGTDNNIVTVWHAAANTATPRSLKYTLWNITDSIVLASGGMKVIPALKSV